jgi:hypothetical protein
MPPSEKLPEENRLKVWLKRESAYFTSTKLSVQIPVPSKKLIN